MYRHVAHAAVKATDQSHETPSERASGTSAKAAAAAALAMGTALASAPNANAAGTGGRIGGSNFQKSTTTSSTTVVKSTTVVTSPTIVPVMAPVIVAAPVMTAPMVAPTTVVVADSGAGTVVVAHHAPNPLVTVGKILLVGAAVWLAFTLVTSFFRREDQGDTIIVEEEEYYDEPPVTVVKVQVGLLASARGLKSDLERLATRGDTSNPEGLHYILQEAVLGLLRSPEQLVYGGVEASLVANTDDAQRRFNALALGERAKFRSETMSNTNGVATQTISLDAGMPFGVAELMVVTILVAAEGRIDLPPIRSGSDLRNVLSQVGGVGPNQLLAVELLWTPQAENDFYTKDQLMMDYPALLPL